MIRSLFAQNPSSYVVYRRQQPEAEPSPATEGSLGLETFVKSAPDPQPNPVVPVDSVLKAPEAKRSVGPEGVVEASGGHLLLELEPVQASGNERREKAGSALEGLEVRFFESPHDPRFQASAAEIVAGRSCAIETAGFSSPPADQPDYARVASEFLSHLIEARGPEDIALVTSSSVGSAIDETTTRLAIDKQLPVVHITCDRYLKYAQPEGLPEPYHQPFRDIPKLVLPTQQDYLEGAADTSSVLFVSGGKGISVTDVKKALDRGNRVVLVDDLDLADQGWDGEKNQPHNASQFLAQVMAGERESPYPWLTADQALIHVAGFHGSQPDESRAAAKKAADFLS